MNHGQLVREVESLRHKVAYLEETQARLQSAELALKESEARFRTIFDGAHDGILVVDPRSRRAVHANGSMCRLSGYNLPELLKLSIDHIHPAESLEFVLNQFYKLLEGKIAIAEDIPVLRRDGVVIYCDITSGYSRFGEEELVFGFFRDVSDRRRREESLREEAAKFETLAEDAPFGMAMISADGRFEYINEEFRSMFGYDLAEIPTGRDWFRRAYPDPEYRHQVVAAWIEDLKATGPGEQRSRILTARCKDGSLKVVNFRSVQLDSGRHLMTCEDITEQRRMQNALTESEQMFRLLSEQSLMSVAVLQDGVYHYANDAMASLLEYSVEEIRAWKQEEFVKVVHPDDRDLVLQQARVKQQGLSGQIPHYQFRVVTKYGASKWVDIYSKTVQFRGRSANLVTMVDITDRKRAEEELQKLAAVVKYSGELVNLATLDGTMIFLNDAGGRMLGIDPLEVERHVVPEVIPEHLERVVKTEIMPELIAGRTWEGELQYKNVRTGKLTDVYAMCFTIKTPHTGEPLFLANVSRDISEQKLAQEKIRESEDKFARAFESGPTPMAITTVEEGRFVDVNEAFLNSVERDKTEVLGKTSVEVGVWCDQGARQAWIDELGEKGFVRNIEVIFKTKSGRVRNGLFSAETVQLRGKPHLLTQINDITERKQAEDALIRSEGLLKAILSASPASITYIEDGTIRWTNPAMVKMFGLETTGEALGTRARDYYVSEGEYRRVRSLFKDRIASHSAFATEARFRTKAGVPFVGELRISPFLSPSGNRGLISAIVDVSERVRAQEELQASQEMYKTLYEESRRQYELYRSLLDSSPDAIVIYDMDGCVKYVNDEFTRLFGWTIEDVLDQRIPYLPDSERDASMALIRRLVDDGAPCSDFETKRYTKDGRTLDISLSASRYLDHDGYPAGMLVVLSDISQRKMLEEQLRHSAKMEAIGQLAGGVAHDFNNILTAVIGYANLLTNELPKAQQYQEKLGHIVSAAEKAAYLTRQLLAFGRKQMLNMKVTPLNEIIADIENLLKRLIGENIAFSAHLNPSVGSVQADLVQIQQILMNLTINARDAVKDGGKVSIETSNAVLDEAYAAMHPEVAPGEYAMFSVSDTGDGMGPETVARIFEPFFSTKAKGVGTGLGLATVYGIVKQHRGHISVYSEPGKGATFKVYLPRVNGVSGRPDPAEPPTTRPSGNETILIVEDEDTVRQLASEILSILGYNALSAGDPAEAIEISNAYPGRIHLLLTDVVLPQMDGRTLFQRLSSDRPNLRVVYASGYTENFIVHHGVLDKDVNFLQKPFDVDGLAKKVRAVLDGS
jgi:PAS domain S-box-containing protein